MDNLEQRLEEVRRRVALASERVCRNPEEVKLIAVSKTKPVELIKKAMEAGQMDFGENYAQELRNKMLAINDPRVRWHFIGTLQRNKVKYLVGKVAMIHSVDSFELIKEIEKRAMAQGVKVPCLIEVKLSPEETKAGVDCSLVEELVRAGLESPYVELRGLMTMPPYFKDMELARPYYRKLREIRDELRVKIGQTDSLFELSMGMSNDFEVAIEEGATFIRVGTAIFGEREK